MDGLTPYAGQITQGLRGNLGGENAFWGIDPRTGQEVPVLYARGGDGQPYLFSDLLQKYGSIEGIRAAGRAPGYTSAGSLPDYTENPNPYYGAGAFDQSLDLFGARPSNDTFSGKDGLRDLATIALMAGGAFGGGALAGEAAGGVATGAAGTAEYGGLAAGAGAGSTGLGTGLGSGLGTAANTSGVIGTGSLGSATATAGGLGGETLGTGLAVPGGTGTGAGLGAGITGGTAGTALAPDFFTADTAGAAGVGGGAGTAAGSGAATAGGLGTAASILGRIAPAALGALGASRQAGALQGLANQYAQYGEPSRARYEQSMTPGFDPSTIPGYSGAVDTASKSVLAKLSANGGNPFGNPGGLIDAQKQVISGTALPAVQEYQRLNAGTGFGTTLNAAGGFGQNAIGAQGNIYNAVGAGINDAINPPQTLAQQLADLKRAGLFTNNSLA